MKVKSLTFPARKKSVRPSQRKRRDTEYQLTTVGKLIAKTAKPCQTCKRVRQYLDGAAASDPNWNKILSAIVYGEAN